MSTSVDDFREAIRERLEPGAAKLVVQWRDGHQQEFDIVDVRGQEGTFIGQTAVGEQVVVGPALEWLLVGRPGESEFQP